MRAKINISSAEHPDIVEGEILFKDNVKAGVNNYIVRIISTDKITSIHKNQIVNYKELLEFYNDKKEKEIESK